MTNGACHQSRTDDQGDHYSKSCNHNQAISNAQPLQNWLHKTDPFSNDGSAEPLPQQESL
jgi:hypothetical protein